MRPTLYLFVGGPHRFRANIITLVESHFEVLGIAQFEPTRQGVRPIGLAPLPSKLDYLFSVACPQVLPADTLESVTEAAINFHPGPPRYPGVGSVTRALLDGREDFGVTAHRMELIPDTGEIWDVESFKIGPMASHQSVTTQTYDALLILFKRHLANLTIERVDVTTGVRWVGPPITLRGYQALLFDPRLADLPIEQVRHALPVGRFYGARDLLCEVMAVFGSVSLILGIWRASHHGRVSTLFIACTLSFLLWLLYQARRGWRTGGGHRWTRHHTRLARVRDQVLGRDPLLTPVYMRRGLTRFIAFCPGWARVGVWVGASLLLTKMIV